MEYVVQALKVLRNLVHAETNPRCPKSGIYAVSFIPEPTAPSAVPGVSPGRGLLIPHGYLHPDKSENSEAQSLSRIAGA